MSAIRQSVAVGIILWALMAMENLKGRKRYFVYSLFIVFATLFHKTAVVALIFPFLMKRKYTRNTTWLLMIITLVATLTNIVSSVISILGLGTGYVTTEIGNAVNVGIVSLLYFALLLLRLFCDNSSYITDEGVTDIEHTAYGDSFYTYCMALSLAVTVMSLRAAGMSRLNMYLQLVGLPYVSNVMRRIENQRVAFIVKVVFSMAIWCYSVIALIYRPEWQHIWPYHFYW